ncbi:MAG: hypothetical protein NT068_00100 [Candidatus Nomurabacteria bacterium]|nr:hypothetical protein [Candidatus Nomurabacteria bacterium]
MTINSEIFTEKTYFLTFKKIEDFIVKKRKLTPGKMTQSHSITEVTKYPNSKIEEKEFTGSVILVFET